MPCIGMKVDKTVMNNCMCEYQSSVMQGIKFLLEKESFTDCTLAAEGKFLNAHKLVLSACSSYFEVLFSQQKEKYPIVFLKDVKFENLKALIELIYNGRIQILAKEKDAFLRTVKDLQIKGWKEKESVENIEHLSVPLKNGTKICSDHTSSSPDLEHHTEVQSYSIQEATIIQEQKCNFSNSPCELEDISICASEPQKLVEIPIEDGFLNEMLGGVDPQDLCPYNTQITCKINELNDISKKLSPSHYGSTGTIQNFRKNEDPWCSPVSLVETYNCSGGLLSVKKTDETGASPLETVFPERTSLTENGPQSDTPLDHVSFPYGSSTTVGHESVRNGQRSTPTICNDTSLMPHLFCEGDDSKNSVSVDFASQRSHQNNSTKQKENPEGYWSSSSSDMDSVCSHFTSGEILECAKDQEFSNTRSNAAAFFENKVSCNHFSEAKKCTNKLDEERITDQSSCLSPVLSWHTLYLENEGGNPSSFTATAGNEDFFTLYDDEQTSKEDVASLIEVPVPQIILGPNFPSHPENVTEECGGNTGPQSSLQPTSKRNKVSFTCSALSEKKEKHICSVCLLSFRSASKLKKHVKIHKSDAKFTCNICLCTFAQDSDLSNHICSTPNKTFPCNKCTLKFFTKEEHDKHSWCHNQYKCEHCEAKLDSEMEAKIHSKTHFAKGSFKCLACANVFQKRDDFITHLREYEHSGEETGNFTDLYCPLNKLEKRAGFWSGDGSFKCHSCNAGFPRRMILKEHIHEHMTEKVLNCLKCDLVFHEKNALYSHVLVNSSRKPFRCQICFAKFSLKKDHATHYQIHLRNKKKSSCKENQ